MTADRDLNRQLAGWLDERVTTTVPEDLLARSLTRVGATRQRPGWLVGDRLPVGSGAQGRAMVPAWAILLLLILAALAVVATGSWLVRQTRTAILADATLAPSVDTSFAPFSTPEMTIPAGPLGGRVILAEIFKGRDVEGPHDIVSIDAGAGVRTVLGTIQGPQKPIFSGAHPVSFQRIASDAHVLVLAGDSGQPVQATTAGRTFGFLTADDVGVVCCSTYSSVGPVLSPSGDRVAFLRVDRFDKPLEIVILRLSDRTSSRVQVPSDTNGFGLLTWSPDESALLTYGCRPCNKATTPQEVQTSHHSHLYVVPLDGSPAQEYGDVDNGSIIGQWAPDGTTIVTATWHCAKGSYMPRCDPAEGANAFGTVRIADGLIANMADDSGDGTGLFEFKVSPDGTRVAYRTNYGLFVRSLDGGAALKVADGMAYNPDWSPDGAWLLFTRNAAELWIVPSVGGDPRLLGSDLAGAAW